MSDLLQLCQTLETVNQDADRLAAELSQRAQRLSQAASQAASVGNGAKRVESAQTAQALHAASKATRQAAQMLHQVAVAGRGFVSRHAGSGTGETASYTVGGVVSADGDSRSRSSTSALSSFWSDHGEEYVPPTVADWDPVPATLKAFSNPKNFTLWVNDGGSSQPGRGVNCADCARAVEVSWRGHPQVSAARGQDFEGESFQRIEGWLGAPLENTNFHEIGNRLSDMRHGASAYVVVTWKGGGGHAFNAVNYNDIVYFIDAQPTGGAVDVWPPKATSPGYGFDEAHVNNVYVNYR